MNLAIKSGYYLEAITIQESIISDRLLSFLIRSNLLDISPEKLHSISFSRLIKIAEPYLDNLNLIEDLHAFRKMRNNCIHGFVKSFPNKPTPEVKDFMALASKTAKMGKQITREIDNWHKRNKRNGFQLR